MRLADLFVESAHGIVHARVSGEIDLSNATGLRRELERAVPNDAAGLILDLSAVDYLDSAGIHLIYRLREDLRTRNQQLRLVLPSDSPVSATLRLAGFDWSGELHEGLGAARQSLDSVAST